MRTWAGDTIHVIHISLPWPLYMIGMGLTGGSQGPEEGSAHTQGKEEAYGG